MKYLVCLFLFAHLEAFASPIILKTGETRIFSSSAAAWIENSRVIRAQQTNSGFRVKAVRPGTSLLKLGKLTYQIDVLSPLQERTMNRLEMATKRTLGLRAQFKDGQVIVAGNLYRWEDWEVLYRACRPQLCDYLMNVDIEDTKKRQIERRLSEKFKKMGLPPQRLLLESPVRALVSPKSPQLSQIKMNLKAFGIDVQTVEGSVDLAPLIKVQITVAEVKRAEVLKYGIQWPESFSAQLVPKYIPSSENTPWSIHALETEGLAKVLATPTLLCRSGKEASFLAGGEFPIKLINFKTQDVIWRKYGIILKISPVADYSGKMSISIETEVSSLDNANKVDGLPGLFTNRIQTHFDLSESRTLALSGLIKNEDSKSSQGLPGLARIPILGSLFGSQDFRENRTELVVFVRPEIVSPGSLEAEE